jgi:hypothetical protein
MIEFIRTLTYGALLFIVISAFVGVCQGLYLGIRDIRAHQLDKRNEIR